MRNISFLLLWLSLCLGGLIYFAMQQLRLFDPDNALQLSMMSTDFERRIEAHFKDKLGQLQNTGVHIQAEGCPCNLANNKHVARLDKQFDQLSFKTVKLSEEQADLPPHFLPSTPALILFNGEGKLRYFGPYSSGYFCNSANSLVDSILDKVAKNVQRTPFIVSDSMGCYCHHSV